MVDSLHKVTSRPPLVQQHWRSGTLSAWHSFQAPYFAVRSTPAGSSLADAELPETVIKQHCYCASVERPCNGCRKELSVV